MIASVAKRIAMLLENEFDDDEVAAIVKLLQESGCDVTFVAPFAGRAYTGRKGAVLTSGMNAAEAQTAGFDAVIVPGGQAPDRLRMRPAVVDLIRDAVVAGTIVGAVSHGPQVLISADVLRGRTVTCWPSIAVDVRNAGALYVDRQVVEDRGVITARKHMDVPKFVEAILRGLGL
jgi:protease I